MCQSVGVTPCSSPALPVERLLRDFAPGAPTDRSGRPPRRDHLHVILRRQRAAERLRELLWGGQAPAMTEFRLQLWATLIGDTCGRGLYGYGELLYHVAPAWVSDNGPWADRTDEGDLRLQHCFRRFLIEKAHREDRYAQAKAMWDSGEVAQGRLKDYARQKLLDGSCPWCDTPLPCVQHDIGVCSIDGRGGLQHVPPSRGAAAQAASDRLRSSARTEEEVRQTPTAADLTFEETL